MFLEQWIGQSRPKAWPVIFPDLNYLDFNICGYLKSTVCATEATDVRDLQKNEHEMDLR